MIHAIQRQRTLAVIRLLTSVGGVRRRGGRLPRLRMPDMIAMEYYKAIAPIASDIARGELERVQGAILRLLEESNQEPELDAADATSPFPGRGGGRRVEKSRRAAELVDKAEAATQERLRARREDIKRIAEQKAQQTSDFNRQQLDRQARAVLGVPIAAIERPSNLDIQGFAAVNVELITTVPERYFDRLRQDVLAAFEKGTPPSDLAKQLARRYDISRDDALRIARDQIGKLNSQVNAARQQAMGITRFIWMTMLDGAVCDFCQDLHGSVFEYADPPECMPGDCHVLDRCYAQPDYSSLSDGGGEGEGGGEEGPDEDDELL